MKRDQRKRACSGVGVSSLMIAGICAAPAASWLLPVANRAGRNRPPALQGMATIGHTVQDVVDQIGRATQAAEEREGREGCHHGRSVHEFPAEEQAGEHDEILRPLIRPKREQQTPQHVPRLCRFARNRRPAELPARHRAGAGHTFGAEKLLMASPSESNVSKTVSSFVIDSKSVMRLVKLTSFRWPPCRLTVV